MQQTKFYIYIYKALDAKALIKKQIILAFHFWEECDPL